MYMYAHVETYMCMCLHIQFLSLSLHIKTGSWSCRDYTATVRCHEHIRNGKLHAQRHVHLRMRAIWYPVGSCCCTWKSRLDDMSTLVGRSLLTCPAWPQLWAKISGHRLICTYGMWARSSTYSEYGFRVHRGPKTDMQPLANHEAELYSL